MWSIVNIFIFNTIISYTTQGPCGVDPLIVSQNHNKIKHVSKRLVNLYYEIFDKF
jgi:hypothetical protein